MNPQFSVDNSSYLRLAVNLHILCRCDENILYLSSGRFISSQCAVICYDASIQDGPKINLNDHVQIL